MNKEQINELLSGIRRIADAVESCNNRMDCKDNHFVANKNRARYRRFNKRHIQPSAVVPDETYTIRELFERAVVNSMPDIGRSYYAEDTSDPSILLDRDAVDFSTLDLVELQEYKDRVNGYIQTHKSRLEEINAKIRELNTPKDPPMEEGK